MEERIIDKDELRGVKRKRTGGEEDAVDELSTDADAADEGMPDYTLEFDEGDGYDEDLVGLTPSQLQEELERRERLREEAHAECVKYLASGEEKFAAGKFREAEKDFSSALEYEYSEESEERLYAAMTDNYTDAQRLLIPDNAERFAHFLGKHYQNAPNLIWILGGDVRGSDGLEVFRKEARILKQYNPERLIGFHPFGRTSSAQWFAKEDWLDFHMFQSGHRRYDQAQLGVWDDNLAKEEFFGEDNWRYVERDYARDEKPVLDGEPSYEGIPQGLHNPRNGFWEEADARRYAYWSVFAGAAGHTYGNNAVIQFYDGKSGTGAYGVRETWQEALHYPGGGQMQYLKGLMESVDFTAGRPGDALLLFGQKERYHRIAVFAGEDFILCYDYMGDEFLLDLTKYMDQTMDIWWMNPQSGACSYAGAVKGEDRWQASPLRRKGDSNDWVLVMRRR